MSYQDLKNTESVMEMISKAAQNAREQHQLDMERHRANVYGGGLPESLKAARLRLFKPRDAADEATFEKARAWREAVLTADPPSLSIFGPPGTGKSWLSAALGWSLLKSERMPKYLRVPDAWARIKATYGGEGSERELMRDWCTWPLLILDELGAGHVTEPYRACMAELIGVRADNGRPTIIASNLAPSNWASVMDERAADRMAGGWQLPIVGKSRRIGQ